MSSSLSSSKILLTRSAIQSAQYAAELQNEGLDVVVSPLLCIEPVSFNIPDVSMFQALIFTSMNGVESFTAYAGVDDIPVYVVGTASAAYARAKGFKNVYSADNNAANLKALLEQKLGSSQGALLYVRGRKIAYDLAGALQAEGFEAEELVAYDALLEDCFNEAAERAFAQKEIKIIPFFSKRTAMNFAEIIRRNNMEEALEHTKALCISEGVLGCVQSLPWAGTFVAKTPDKEAVTNLIREHVR